MPLVQVFGEQAIFRRGLATTRVDLLCLGCHCQRFVPIHEDTVLIHEALLPPDIRTIQLVQLAELLDLLVHDPIEVPWTADDQVLIPAGG